MNKTQEILLSLVRSALFGEPFSLPADTDWDALFLEATAQAVQTLIAPQIPPEHAAPFQQAMLQNRARYTQLLYEQNALLALLEKENIRAVILKGIAAAKYYPVPSNRGMGDVDVLVSREAYPRATELLASNGYAFMFENKRHTEYSKNGALIEIHRRFSDDHTDIDDALNKAFSHVREEVVNGSAFPVFPEAENGLVILAHIRHHFKTSGLGLRHLTDWAMFVHANPSETFWTERFFPLAENAGLLTFARALTRSCRDYLGLPESIPGCEKTDPSLAERLLHRFLSDGNFGGKTEEKERPLEYVTITIRKGGFFKLLQSAGEANWKACQKYPVLKPFAFLYQFFRFLGKGIARLFSGKAKKDLKEGNERYALYRDLDIE